MKKKFKRIISIVLAGILVFIFHTTVLAAEPNSNISTFSTISGYHQGTVSKNNSGFVVTTTGSGIGGMGITIKNTCSSGNYRIGVSIIEYSTNRLVVDNRTAYTNQEVQFHDITTYNTGHYIVNFHDIPEGISVSSQVWIYG